MTTPMSLSKTLKRCRRLPRRLWQRVAARRYPVVDLGREPAGPLEAFYAHRGRPCLIRCSLADCRWYGPTGIAYGPDSRHPYVQSLHQFVSGRHRDYRGSCLEYYWQSWQPATLARSLGLADEDSHPWLQQAPPMSDIMPWGDMRQLEALRACVERLYQGEGAAGALLRETAVRQVGPKPAWFGERRVKQLIGLYEAILREGYREKSCDRMPYFEQHIVVDTLQRGDEVRFLVANGQHRASVLSVLGYEQVPVLVHVPHHRGPSLVRREDYEHWPLVRHGIVSPREALKVFDRVFDGNHPAGLPRLVSASELEPA